MVECVSVPACKGQRVHNTACMCILTVCKCAASALRVHRHSLENMIFLFSSKLQYRSIPFILKSYWS